MVAAKTAKPDGYTIILGTTSTLAINPTLHPSLPYDPIKDFLPASNLVIAPFVLVAHPGFAARTVSEVVAAAKREPGKLSFASTGAGSAQHMTGELFKSRAGIDIVHIPYKGTGPGITDLVGGQVPLMFDSVAATLPYIKSGRVKAIAVTTLNRVPQLPDVPTIAESGYVGFEGMGWAGIVLPAGTPRSIVERVSADIRNALDDPEFRGVVLDRGAVPDPRTPESFAEFIRNETAKWKRVANEAKVRLD